MTKHVVQDPARGIIIIANSLPNMAGADMSGNVRVGELLMHRRGLGLVRGVPHLKNLLVRELEGVAKCWGLPHCLEEKEKTKSWVNPRNFQVSMRQNLCQKKSIFGCEEKIEISSPSRIIGCPHQTLC